MVGRHFFATPFTVCNFNWKYDFQSILQECIISRLSDVCSRTFESELPPHRPTPHDENAPKKSLQVLPLRIFWKRQTSDHVNKPTVELQDSVEWQTYTLLIKFVVLLDKKSGGSVGHCYSLSKHSKWGRHHIPHQVNKVESYMFFWIIQNLFFN